jgi:tRNA A-37 threonylcarbamoyl transferase component Bud32
MSDQPNPYLSRGPVRSQEMFFGRDHELHEIANFIKGNQSVSIVGPRKIGKTSLVFHLMRPQISEELGIASGTLVCYLDCEVLGQESAAEVFQQFAAELRAEVESRGQPEEPALETACLSPSRLAFEGAIRALNRRGMQVVMVLDEFERLSANPQLDVNFFNALRSIAGRFHLVFLTASASPLIELTYSARSQDILSSPFFNIFAPVFLGPLPEKDARDLIFKPSERAGKPFPLPIQNFLLEYSGRHPLILQIACFHAFTLSVYQDEIERRTAQEMQAHFEYSWRNLSEEQKRVLRELPKSADRPSATTSVHAVYRELESKCLIRQTQGRYEYASKAWADFLALQTASVSAAASSMKSIIGCTLGQYEILEPIGRGGMAEVYKARHIRLERPVAVKILPARLAEEGDFRERFEREARAVALLKHPNIVQVYDFGDCDGLYYMAMEYIPGRDLAYKMSQLKKLPLAQVWWVASDLAAALDYAHARGIVHRDVKPSNVLLEPISRLDKPAPKQGAKLQRAILTDFGIAKILESGERSTRGGLFGTVEYMSPEQIRAEAEIDGRADIYAMGIMLFEMLTGRLPFTAETPSAMVMAHLDTPAPDPREYAPELPEKVAMAVLRAMAKPRDVRFSTAKEFIRAMR